MKPIYFTGVNCHREPAIHRSCRSYCRRSRGRYRGPRARRRPCIARVRSRRPVAARLDVGKQVATGQGRMVSAVIDQTLELLYVGKTPVASARIIAETTIVVVAPTVSTTIVQYSGINHRIVPGFGRIGTIGILQPDQSCQIICHRTIAVVCKPRTRPGNAFLQIPVISRCIGCGLPGLLNRGIILLSEILIYSL